MRLGLQKRLASEILKVGKTRIWIDPESQEEVSKAITRNDIHSLINRNVIQVKPKKGVSRGRARILDEKRKKKRRKGHGRRKGASGARSPKKREWMNQVRPLRQLLKAMKTKEKLTTTQYRQLYLKIKGNFFRSRSHLKTYVEKLMGK